MGRITVHLLRDSRGQREPKGRTVVSGVGDTGQIVFFPTPPMSTWGGGRRRESGEGEGNDHAKGSGPGVSLMSQFCLSLSRPQLQPAHSPRQAGDGTDQSGTGGCGQGGALGWPPRTGQEGMGGGTGHRGPSSESEPRTHTLTCARRGSGPARCGHSGGKVTQSNEQHTGQWSSNFLLSTFGALIWWNLRP